jgi:ubiquinol-cytochrome c reductase cytochrome c1 subunit
LTCSGLVYALDETVKADMSLHPAKLPWNHLGMFDALDHSSVRRGYEVYKQVNCPIRAKRFRLSDFIDHFRPEFSPEI